MLYKILLVATGGACGATVRYLSSVLAEHFIGSTFPIATMMVNVVGAFLIGLLTGFVSDPQIKLLLITGILGGFTTFSTFSLDAVKLYQSGQYLSLAAYVLGSILLGTVFTAIGLAISSKT